MDELEEIRKKKLEKMMSDSTKDLKVEYPSKPVVLTDGSMDAAVKQYPLLIVDCWAEWCGPCRSVAPTIDELARELSGKVVFGKLNVDENFQTSSKYGISAIPTMLVFKGGKLVDRIVGAYPKPALKSKVQKYI
ncbi:MAG: thioredoxin [Methanosarcinales archaeon]|nr:thioredoxin [Methanosarcinales archaeon]